MSKTIIDIEGIDGVGKGTQSKILFSRLQSLGYHAELLSFPKYDSFFGGMVGQYLNGKFGDLKTVPTEFAALLYALDRWNHFAERVSSPLQRVDITITDRYVPSNIAHQASKLDSGKRAEFISWISRLEYDMFKVPRPSLVLVLDADPQISRHYILKKNARAYTTEKMDLHESDSAYLSGVRDLFLEMASLDKSFHIVNCTDGNALRSVEEISEIIWGIVNNFIKTNGLGKGTSND
jgi:dTMP kinase